MIGSELYFSLFVGIVLSLILLKNLELIQQGLLYQAT